MLKFKVQKNRALSYEKLRQNPGENTTEIFFKELFQYTLNLKKNCFQISADVVQRVLGFPSVPSVPLPTWSSVQAQVTRQEERNGHNH